MTIDHCGGRPEKEFSAAKIYVNCSGLHGSNIQNKFLLISGPFLTRTVLVHDHCFGT